MKEKSLKAKKKRCIYRLIPINQQQTDIGERH